MEKNDFITKSLAQVAEDAKNQGFKARQIAKARIKLFSKFQDNPDAGSISARVSRAIFACLGTGYSDYVRIYNTLLLSSGYELQKDRGEVRNLPSDHDQTSVQNLPSQMSSSPDPKATASGPKDSPTQGHDGQSISKDRGEVRNLPGDDDQTSVQNLPSQMSSSPDPKATASGPKDSPTQGHDGQSISKDRGEVRNLPGDDDQTSTQSLPSTEIDQSPFNAETDFVSMALQAEFPPPAASTELKTEAPEFDLAIIYAKENAAKLTIDMAEKTLKAYCGDNEELNKLVDLILDRIAGLPGLNDDLQPFVKPILHALTPLVNSYSESNEGITSLIQILQEQIQALKNLDPNTRTEVEFHKEPVSGITRRTLWECGDETVKDLPAALLLKNVLFGCSRACGTLPSVVTEWVPWLTKTALSPGKVKELARDNFIARGVRKGTRKLITTYTRDKLPETKAQLLQKIDTEEANSWEILTNCKDDYGMSYQQILAADEPLQGCKLQTSFKEGSLQSLQASINRQLHIIKTAAQKKHQIETLFVILDENLESIVQIVFEVGLKILNKLDLEKHWASLETAFHMLERRESIWDPKKKIFLEETWDSNKMYDLLLNTGSQILDELQTSPAHYEALKSILDTLATVLPPNETQLP